MTTAGPVSPWLPTAPCAPDPCARHSGPATGSVLAVARLVAGIATVLAGLLCAPLAALLPAAGRRALVRVWCRLVIRAFGVRIKVTGVPAPADGPLLVVANHISWLDVPLVATVVPGRMLAKREIRGWPVLGPVAARGGTLFIDRDRLRALPDTVRTMAGAMAGGGRVVVFPEGSTWCGRGGGAFRHAAFQAALDASAPVLPVRLVYRPVGPAAFVGEDPLAASLWRIVAARGLTAEIRILDPISTIQYPNRRALAQAAQRAVESDSAKRPSLSVHQRVSSSPAPASSARTPA
ncbi:lysophospholipid acyltransferase family protein [Streptomyces sp. P9(2023)]|uniref:lysophospholipid acyltransferase family protein n=1 Tax=Streptomyces sp. P9(2023) TaxID=3064394 RepID=UPI0028F42317|nr:lysophospholipid acyltransferase family protein [Streptomyces sp. P9(2023)]MDT9687239.1 lysophospholipid acyltransferase family protein [Streptomyces sp. P9(2023)]